MPVYIFLSLFSVNLVNLAKRPIFRVDVLRVFIGSKPYLSCILSEFLSSHKITSKNKKHLKSDVVVLCFPSYGWSKLLSRIVFLKVFKEFYVEFFAWSSQPREVYSKERYEWRIWYVEARTFDICIHMYQTVGMCANFLNMFFKILISHVENWSVCLLLFVKRTSFCNMKSDSSG